MEPDTYLCFVEGNTPMRWFRSEYVQSLEKQLEDLKAEKADLRAQVIKLTAALVPQLRAAEPSFMPTTIGGAKVSRSEDTRPRLSSWNDCHGCCGAVRSTRYS